MGRLGNLWSRTPTFVKLGIPMVALGLYILPRLGSPMERQQWEHRTVVLKNVDHFYELSEDKQHQILDDLEKDLKVQEEELKKYIISVEEMKEESRKRYEEIRENPDNPQEDAPRLSDEELDESFSYVIEEMKLNIKKLKENRVAFQKMINMDKETYIAQMDQSQSDQI